MLTKHSWSVAGTPRDAPLEKPLFPFQQVPVANNFWVREGLCAHFLLSALGVWLLCTCAGVADAVMISVSARMPQVLLCLQDTLSLESPTTSGS